MQSSNYLINSDDYDMVKKINEGSYGVIFLVQNKQTHEYFAAKVLKEINSDEVNEMTEINNEVKILKQCQHPTIVRFYGLSCKKIEGRVRYTIFLDYFQNGSLSDILKRHRSKKDDFNLDNTSKQIILIGVARGMMYLHQHRIIHNDLKPGNILLDDNLHPHITDFGFSQSFQNYEVMQSMSCNIGTPAYMSPEAIEGKPYTAKSDVYSFAILMFEVLNGTEPYPDARNAAQVFTGVVDGGLRPKFSPKVRRSLKESLIDLVEECWSPNQDRRPNFEEIFQRLAFGKDQILGDLMGNNDSYYLDDVDVEAVRKYVDLIVNDDSKNDFVPVKYVDQLTEKVNQMAEQMNELNPNKNDDERLNQLEEEIQMLKIDLKRQVEIIDDRFQIYAYNLTDATFPNSITQIPSKVFINCVRLTTVTIPDSVTIIMSAAFAGCSSLVNLTIPDSVLIIESFAFSRCSSLKYIKLPPIAILNKNVLAECSSLQKVIIPPTVKQIDKYAFLYCKSLKSIEIPSSVDLIKRAAFRGCSSLSKVVLKGETSIENDAFDECTSLKNIPKPNVAPRKKSFFGYISSFFS